MHTGGLFAGVGIQCFKITSFVFGVGEELLKRGGLQND